MRHGPTTRSLRSTARSTPGWSPPRIGDNGEKVLKDNGEKVLKDNGEKVLNRLYNNRLYSNRRYNNMPIRHRQQGSAYSILGGLREGRRAGVLGTCKRPRTVRLPVRVRSPLSAQLPEYCNEMASPWSAHMHLNCRLCIKTPASQPARRPLVSAAEDMHSRYVTLAL